MAKGGDIWPEEQSSPFAEIFSEETPTLPGIVLVDDMAALKQHMEAGTLDLTEVERRYGKGCWRTTKKILLPGLQAGADRDRVFTMEGACLLPPRKLS